MKTSAEDLERNYDKPDPWGYQTNPADIERKQYIINALRRLVSVGVGKSIFNNALDIGCGEGWISQDLPAQEIYGFEHSMQAKKRWHPSIIDYMHRLDRPDKFELVIGTGILYRNYAWKFFVDLINKNAGRYIVTSNIAGREHWPAIEAIEGNLIHLEEFPYHRGPDEMFTQRLRVYRR